MIEGIIVVWGEVNVATDVAGPELVSITKKRVATNTVEYCTTPQEERYPYWEVPYGYNVSDSPTTVRSDNMKKRWRRIMEENNIEADPRFPDWNPKISRTG